MLINLNWWECNKILRLLDDSHKSGSTFAGDDELAIKIRTHKRSIEAEKEWVMKGNVPVYYSDEYCPL